MHTFTRPAAAVAAVAVTALALAGCSGGGGGTPTGSDGDYVDGGTFTVAMIADPGALDPQASATTGVFMLGQFAYDSLVSSDRDGNISSQLAKEWSVDGQTLTFTLNDGITCSDGSEFTAQTAADNFTWIADPNNQSPLLGSFFPPGATAEADGSTLTITLAAPAPFALAGISNIPLVCDAGMADRSILAAGTSGTGPYVLTEAVPNDHYTFEVREGYTWGPDGATTAETGQPATFVARIIPNETTAANLVLSGEVNASAILGPDAQRLDQAELFSVGTEALVGEQWYNQNDGHATADPAVRMALTQALDLAELQKVLTGASGAPATRLAVIAPSACTYDAVTGNVPATDVAGAEAALDAAGWALGSDGVRAKDGQKLELTFLYANTLGTGGTSAAELAVKQWEAIGVKAEAVSNDTTTITNAVFATGAWDVVWLPLNVNNPDQVVGFVSGTPSPEGTNFGATQNADYEAGVAAAMELPGTDGCDTWKDAEAALFSAADIIPFANSVVNTYANGAVFELVDNIEPTTIRMLAG